MTDLVAPNHVASVVIDTEEYSPDDQGVVTAKTPEHAVLLKLHGFRDKADVFGHRFGSAVEGTFTEFRDEGRADLQELLDSAKAREEHLMATLQSLMADVAALKASGTSAPSASTMTVEDTSGSLGDTEKGPDAPDLNTATRDDLVKWLNANDVPTPGNISRDAAVELAKQNGAK